MKIGGPRMFSLACFIATFVIGWGTFAEYIEFDGSSGNPRISVPQGANATVYAGKHAVFVVSGKEMAPAAEIIASMVAKGNNQEQQRSTIAESPILEIGSQPPDEPFTIKLLDRKMNLVGGLSELIPGMEIFIGARHLFQQWSYSDLEAALARNKFYSREFWFYEVRYKQERIDVIMMLPPEQEAYVFENVGDNTFKLRPDHLSMITARIDKSDEWFSHQFGSMLNKPVEQSSKGSDIRPGFNDYEPFYDRFWLNKGPENFSTAGSSGALVFLLTKHDAEIARLNSTRIPNWKIGGLIECQDKGGKLSNGSRYLPGIRVIPFSLLYRAKWVRIDPADIAQEERRKESKCLPLDRRDGGGPNRDGGRK